MQNFDVEIRQVVPFTGEGCTKATVMFRVGPLMIRCAKIFEKDGQRWLSMPARRVKNGRWFEVAAFASKQAKTDIQNAVLAQYEIIEQQTSDLLQPETISA